MNAYSSNYEMRNMGRVGWFCNRTACVSQAKKLVGRIFLGFFPNQEKTNNVFAEKRAEIMPPQPRDGTRTVTSASRLFASRAMAAAKTISIDVVSDIV